MKFIYFISILLCASKAEVSDKSWQQDLTENIKIGLEYKGFTKAVLECSEDWVAFVLSTEKDFKGVIYARGYFQGGSSPCFKNAQEGKDFALKMPLNQCGLTFDKTLGGYTTTIVVQHDKELIFPGDLAFTLVCKDENSKTANLEGMRSSIALADPDPAKRTDPSESLGSLSAMSPTNRVTLVPPKPAKSKKDKQEL